MGLLGGERQETSGVQRGDAGRCRALGVNDYVTKPVRAAELHAAVAMLVAELSSVSPKNDNQVPLITHHFDRRLRATVSLRGVRERHNLAARRHPAMASARRF
jgi:DNA-binding response OmpR family regulator